MRLAADVADADTLRCIERAELATDVIGGSSNDYHLLKLNRAHWTLLAGDATTAIGLLEELCRLEDGISPQRTGEACLLLGRAYIATGNNAAARDVLLRAADQFEMRAHRSARSRPGSTSQARPEATWRCVSTVSGHAPLSMPSGYRHEGT